MDEYKKPYLRLFNSLSDAIEHIDKMQILLAKALLIQAQQEAEEVFLAQENTLIVLPQTQEKDG